MMILAILIKATALAVLAAASATHAPSGERVPEDETRSTAGAGRVLYDFAARPVDVQRWRTVMDGVMGGRSSGRIESSPEGHLLFSGRLSLENNGGFAAMRSPADAAAWHLPGADAFVLRVRGDGRTYRFDALLRTGREEAGGSYVPGGEQWRVWQEFATVKGEWIEVTLPFSGFSNPTFYGTEMPVAPELDVSRIARVGVMLYDKRPGPYRIEIASIRTAGGAMASSGEGSDTGYADRLAGLLSRLESPVAADAGALSGSEREVQAAARLASLKARLSEPYEKKRERGVGRDVVESVLVEAVRRGAPLFNNRQPAACAAVYETALSSILLLTPADLSDQEVQNLQEVLSASWHDPSERAWTLRRVIDDLLGLTRS